MAEFVITLKPEYESDNLSNLDDVVCCLDRWRDDIADLRTSCALIGGLATAQRGTADDRSFHGLLPLQYIAAAKAVLGTS